MISVAVIAHAGKTFGGGLDELRAELAAAGHRPIWYEVARSSKAPKAVRQAVKDGAGLIFVWGGDGMVQRCIDALGRPDVAIAIVPAGTGNLLATSLGIPKDIAKAVNIGLHGRRRRLDVGVMNGERFAAMAGTGFDAIMVKAASSQAKDQLGRLAYLRSGMKAMRARSVRMKIRVDDEVWFTGKATCALIGNIGTVTGGLRVLARASPSDGKLDVGVFTPKTAWQWVKVLVHEVTGMTEDSPQIQTRRGKKIVIKLERKRPYELDGGARPRTDRLDVRIEARAITVCVPASGT